MRDALKKGPPRPARLHYIQNPVTLLERVNELVDEHGNWRTAAEAVGTDHAHLWRISRGDKTPSDELLQRMGLKKHVHYTKV